MQFHKFFSFSFFLIFGNAFLVGSTLELINQKHIEEHTKNITTELNKTYYAKIGLASLLSTALGYSAYTLFNPSVAPTVSAVVNQQQPTTLDELGKKLNSLDEAIKAYRVIIDGQRDMLADQGYAPYTNVLILIKSWAKFLGRQFVFIGIGSVVTGTLTPFTKYFQKFESAVDAGIDKLFHPNDLKWYLSTHTNLEDIFAHMENHLDLWSTQSIQSEQDYYRDGFIDACALYTHHLEKILGFMAYKTPKITQQSALNGKRAQTLSEHLISRYNQTIEEIKSRLSANAGAQALKEHCCQLNRLVQESIASYSAGELLAGF